MTLSININPGQAVSGGVALGVMTSAGNPWSVPDELAHSLVQRGVATAFNWLAPVPTSLTAAHVAALTDSMQAISNLSANPVKRWLPFLDPTSSTPWDDRAGTGLTVAVDTTVLFQGQPTLKLTIPAGSSGTYRVGNLLATIGMPYNWDGKQLALAMMSSNLTACDGFASVLLGDATFTNFYSFGGQRNAANVPEAIWQANEWMVTRGTVPTVGGGTPTFTGLKRARINFTITSVATETAIWLGFFGVCASRAKPTVIFSVDDGYRSGYTFLADVCRFYRLPVSFGIDRFYQQSGAANYMTEAMIRELQADKSDLFEFVTHGYNNQNVTTNGDAQYVADNIATRAYIRSLGVGDGADHHPWVQSLQTNAAITLMQAAGFKSARMGASTPKSTHDGLWATLQDKRRYQQLNCCTLTTGLTVSAAQTAIAAAVTEGYGVTHVNAHDFAAADAASPPTWSYDKMVELAGHLAAQRDAGTIELKTWGRWWADLAGEAYSKHA